MIELLVAATVAAAPLTDEEDPLEAALAFQVHVADSVDEAEAQAAEAAEEAAAEAEAERIAAAEAPSRDASSSSVWWQLADCETEDASTTASDPDWAYNGSSGFDGGLQFDPSTWAAMAPAGYPDAAYLASPEQQIHVAELTLAVSSWSQQWPGCSAQLGLN